VKRPGLPVRWGANRDGSLTQAKGESQQETERDDGDDWEGPRLTIEAGSGFKRRRHRPDDGGESFICMSYMFFRSFMGASCGILLAVSFAGCVTKFETGSQQAPDANFARRSTFRFVPDKSQAAFEAVSSGPDWRGLISQDILTALNAKGYRLFPNRQTDLLVAFHIVLTDNESVTTLDNYLGYQLTAGQSAQADLSRFQDPSHPGEASKGTLIIDFVDPKKRVLLWRGWTKTNVDLKQSGEKLQALAKEAVNQILAKFPSRS
jgi:hypothetical protein